MCYLSISMSELSMETGERSILSPYHFITTINSSPKSIISVSVPDDQALSGGMWLESANG